MRKGFPAVISCLHDRQNRIAKRSNFVVASLLLGIAPNTSSLLSSRIPTSCAVRLRSHLLPFGSPINDVLILHRRRRIETGSTGHIAFQFNGAMRGDAASMAGSSSSSMPAVAMHGSVENVAEGTSPLSFSTYLSSMNVPLKRKDDSILNVIMGNEAGDADSIVSSLALGYVNYIESFTGDNQNEHDSTVSMPLVSIAREDMTLRRDATLLLDMCGVDTEKLLYLNDPTAQSLLFSENTSDDTCEGKGIQVTLVDHNKIRSSLAHISDAVNTILDHHEDEGHHKNVAGERRNIAFRDRHATVGSTCTLVAERLIRSMNGSSKIDRGVGLALLGVILLDTMNMSVEAGKGTPRDESCIRSLLNRTDWSSESASSSKCRIDDKPLQMIFPDGAGSAPDRQALHDYLCGSKFDVRFWEKMSARDCLRIDYKRFEPQISPTGGNVALSSFGLSSVLLPIASLLKKDRFFSQALRYMQEADVPLLGILSMTLVDGVPNREMLLVGEETAVEGMAKYLLLHQDAAVLKVTEQELDLQNWLEEGGVTGILHDLGVRLFRQGNTKGSRKQVAPVMLKYATNGSSMRL